MTLTPYPHQNTAVEFCLSGRRAVYLYLEPGLGKTIVSSIVFSLLHSVSENTSAVYICPGSLVVNTREEFRRWGSPLEHLTVVGDWKLSDEKEFQTVVKHARKISGLGCNILFIDESHRFLNPKAKRTLSLKLLANHFDKVVFMSGTPMPNSRPIELWPMLQLFAPDVFGEEFWPYVRAYCNPVKTPFGWDFKGMPTERQAAQLFGKLRDSGFMIRMLKEEVLDLPARIESVLTIGEDIPPMISKFERKILSTHSMRDLMKRPIAFEAGKGGDIHIAEYLRLLGLHKLKYILPVIQSILEDTRDNILIFAYNHAVIDKLVEWLKNHDPVVITGKTPVDHRPKLVEEYQTNPKRRIFIGNVLAAGLGHTLTKANRVLLFEFSWRDGDNKQAIDRAHRIGQKQTVLAQYVVLKDSLDAKRINLLLEKRHRGI
jgi:SWI/SNF-related matrix-associated actin-dependent regulator 1 of chromatin subfamily A